MPNGLAKTSGRLLYVDVYIFSKVIFKLSILLKLQMEAIGFSLCWH